MPRQDNNANFNIPYGVASVAITTGSTIVATTGASYHGISVNAGSTAKARITIYDSISATTGNILDVFIVNTDNNVWIDRYIPIMAKYGIVVSMTGTGASGAVFYGPKG